MGDQAQLRRMLGWYPRSWRDRYGKEMSALLEDTYADGGIPFRSRLALIRAGVGERV